jgi:hypothetical protein
MKIKPANSGQQDLRDNREQLYSRKYIDNQRLDYYSFTSLSDVIFSATQ